MTAVTPATLAQFVHRVPDGTILPAGTEVLLGPRRRRPDHWIGPRRLPFARVVNADGGEYWTREPVAAPVTAPVAAPDEPRTLAECAYSAALAEVVARLDRIEGTL